MKSALVRPLCRGATGLLAAAVLSVCLHASEPVASADWSEAMGNFAQADAAQSSSPGTVLFVGSSSIRLWSTLAADFPEVPVLNRGFGGSQIADSLVHFDHLVTPHHPRLIVFYAGTNDLAAGKSPEEVAADFREFCEKVHASRPDTRILFVSIQLAPARWQLRDKMALTNIYIAAFCAADPRRVFVETNAAMLAPDGSARLEFFVEDRLHLSPAGYAMWRKILSSLLVQ
ncbi:MAG: GDSL-type esterase/lipase family protein [Candidatus Didemnitutus sp.]|nr:GDSL-type esterase/lipase family protein [Candidatus Didemnitutus sp.]